METFSSKPVVLIVAEYRAVWHRPLLLLLLLLFRTLLARIFGRKCDKMFLSSIVSFCFPFSLRSLEVMVNIEYLFASMTDTGVNQGFVVSRF